MRSRQKSTSWASSGSGHSLFLHRGEGTEGEEKRSGEQAGAGPRLMPTPSECELPPLVERESARVRQFRMLPQRHRQNIIIAIMWISIRSCPEECAESTGPVVPISRKHRSLDHRECLPPTCRNDYAYVHAFPIRSLQCPDGAGCVVTSPQKWTLPRPGDKRERYVQGPDRGSPFRKEMPRLERDSH